MNEDTYKYIYQIKIPTEELEAEIIKKLLSFKFVFIIDCGRTGYRTRIRDFDKIIEGIRKWYKRDNREKMSLAINEDYNCKSIVNVWDSLLVEKNFSFDADAEIRKGVRTILIDDFLKEYLV